MDEMPDADALRRWEETFAALPKHVQAVAARLPWQAVYFLASPGKPDRGWAVVISAYEECGACHSEQGCDQCEGGVILTVQIERSRNENLDFDRKLRPVLPSQLTPCKPPGRWSAGASSSVN